MEQFFVTTLDNPFCPFTQFDNWHAFDQDKGYNTCAYLARIVESSPELSEEEQIKAVNSAVDEICRLNVLGIYKRIGANEVNQMQTA